MFEVLRYYLFVFIVIVDSSLIVKQIVYVNYLCM